MRERGVTILLCWRFLRLPLRKAPAKSGNDVFSVTELVEVYRISPIPFRQAYPFMGRCCVGKGCGNLITLEIPSTFFTQGLAKSRNDENLLPPCSFSALRNLSGDCKGTGTV